MLIEFYGKECEHCLAMEPLVERLEKETGVKLTRYEVWHDAENAKRMDQYDTETCGGVPFFVNTDTEKTICGEASYEELELWSSAKG